MSTKWEPQEDEVYQAWVDAILEEASDELNEWETKFMDSIQIRLNFRNSLTEEQAKKLESIYAERTK
jgi:thiaminase